MAVELTRLAGGFSLHKTGEAAVAYAGAEFELGLREENSHLSQDARDTIKARLGALLTQTDQAGLMRSVTIGGFTFKTGC